MGSPRYLTLPRLFAGDGISECGDFGQGGGGEGRRGKEGGGEGGTLANHRGVWPALRALEGLWPVEMCGYQCHGQTSFFSSDRPVEEGLAGRALLARAANRIFGAKAGIWGVASRYC